VNEPPGGRITAMNYIFIVVLGTSTLVLSLLYAGAVKKKRRTASYFGEKLGYYSDVAVLTSSTAKPEIMLNKLREISIKQLKLKSFYIYLLSLDSASYEKWLKCIVTPGSASFEGFASFAIRSKNEVSTVLNILNEKKPAVLNIPDKMYELFKQSKFTAIPIKTGDTRIGVILTDPALQAEDIPLLEFCSNQLGMTFENVVLNEKIKEYAIIDELTNVYNYRYFQEKLSESLQLARRYKNYISLAIIDIDDFKYYNNVNGKTAGDSCLFRIATIAKNTIRTGDNIFRFSGEEFCLILPATDRNGALVACEKIRSAIENFSFEYGNKQPKGKITVSIGLSTYPNDAHEPEDLIETSKKALENAKSGGKNQVCSGRSKQPQEKPYET
jgi:diguanylate cyclase (GGDEF)-like protein